MNNAYRTLMDQQCLSEEVKQAVISNLLRSGERNSRTLYLRTAIITMCILLMIPITVLAAERIFGIPVVEFVKGNLSANIPGTGYEVKYPEVTRRQLSEFSEEIQTMEDYRLVEYDSWQQAEEALGITLINNTFLSDKSVTKARTYNLKGQGIPHGVHCFTQYNGLNNQLYRATVRAAYHYHYMHIQIRSVVTCDHPAISAEDASRMYRFRVTYNDHLVEDISQEQYLTANGINATIVSVTQTGRRPTIYEATFFTNDASYQITIQSKYDNEQATEAKEILIEILDSFIF